MPHPSPRRAFVIPPRPLQTSRASPAFDVQLFLDSVGVGRRVATFHEKETVYSQGDLAKDVIYIREGGVRLTVVNTAGREAVVAILGPGDFCGESCLVAESARMATATAIAPLSVLVIDNKEMLRLLHSESAFFDRFITYMLQRKARIEEDLIDQLFNSSEKRLARTLLLLARSRKQAQPQRVLLTISQETLAEMVGTTRPRVNFFMNKFKKLGYIQYDGGLQINASLLNIFLNN
jgi:CRP/FNR family transcriptional regulator, cyclic AMP receptor protein